MCPLAPNLNRAVSTGLFEKMFMAFIGRFWVNFTMVIEEILKKCYIATTLF